MYKFDGIKTEGIWLLAQNRFENNKQFYEEHKEEIKKLVINPAKQLATIIAEDMYKYDSFMELNPSKMVSRVRRDTRFSKDKSMYRENMWIMFMRSKKIDPFVPCFWFEFFQDQYTCGVGAFQTNARVNEIYRQKILDNSSEFRKAVKSCLSEGCQLGGISYKKPNKLTDTLPKDIQNIYNMKNVSFRKTFSDMSRLEKEETIDELRYIYSKMNPFYQFLLKVYQQYKLERSEYYCEQRDI